MPTVTREARGQRYGKNDAERLFRVNGTFDYAVAVSAVFGGATPLAPAQWGDFSLVDYDAREVAKAPGLWEVRAIYGSVAVEILQGVAQVSFDIGHAMESLMYARGAGASFLAPGVAAVDFGRAIGVGSDGGVSGVQVPAPRQAFQIRTKKSTGQVTDAYIASVFAAVGKINSIAWKGYKAQELLFLGARLDQMNALEWDCTFLFQAEYEKTNLTVGPITGITKKGWQYLWVYALPTTVTPKPGLRKPVEVPAIARVEDVHETIDFNLLAIPGATNNPGGMVPGLAPI